MSSSRVLVFGATGATGRLFVDELVALYPSMDISLYVRSSSKAIKNNPVWKNNNRIHLVEGDVTDAVSIEKCFSSSCASDGVALLLGHSYGELSTSRFMSECAKIVLESMKKHNVTRLIDITGVALGGEDDSKTITLASPWYGIMTGFLHLTKNSVLQDHGMKTSFIESAAKEWKELEYTIVRPSLLTNSGKSNGKYLVTAGIGSQSTGAISREDVAEFMAKEFLEKKWLGKKPVISSKGWVWA
jgi:nucleoside-diphosphate-sugar epimerase